MEYELLTQSNVTACCLPALTGLVAQSGASNTEVICDKAIAIGVVMAGKLDSLEAAETAAPAEEPDDA